MHIGEHNILERDSMGVALLTSSDGTTELFNFYHVSNINTWTIKSSAITFQNVPSLSRPFAFDGKTREEEISFEFVLLPTTYSAGDIGTGTFLDQLADLLYVYRNQGAIIKAGGVTSPNPYLILYITYHSNSAITNGHTSAKITPSIESGFTNAASVYYLPCIIKDIAVSEIDIMQRRVRCRITVQRVYRVVAYG